MGEESLGHMIKRRRETLGFSQARLGELVGRSASTIRNWERNKSSPAAVSDAVALAAVLGLSENRVVEAAGFQADDIESGTSLEQGYASLAPGRSSADDEAVESEPVAVEPSESDPTESEPAQPEPSRPEAAQPEPSRSESSRSESSRPEPEEPMPAAAISREAEPESPAVSAPAAAAEDAAPTEPDEAEKEETPASVEPEADAGSARAFPPPSRLLQAVFTNTDPEEEPSSDEPSVSRAAPPTVLETPPPVEPSYLEDPDERQRYRARALATAAVVVFLLIVFLWSFDRTVDALGTMWNDFTGMLEL